MIKIDHTPIDLVVQAEDSAAINKLMNKLNLDTSNVLIICSKEFFARLVIFLYEESHITGSTLSEVEEDLTNGKNSILTINYKGKEFTFYFIILVSETKTVDNPFKGKQTFKTGFREINI